ncbi:MAG TPA: nuclear transport factor 2 family protein [Tepidisphaeraceae bacterium]|nr:nuclear transport factor 2 family protein [Tepidisphaeraceae bacterium]
MSQSNIERVKSVYAAFGHRDMEEIARLMSPEIVIEQSTELPWGGRYQGLQGLTMFFTALLANVNSSLVFERFLDAGDHVVVIGWTRGTTVKDGRAFDVPIAHVWKIRDGQLASFRPFIDNPTMLAALSK